MWTPPREECPHPERWSAPDSQAAEREVSGFLAALCVLLRPERVLETGSYLGHTTLAIGRALEGHGGWLDSLEKEPARWRAAREATVGLPVTVHLADSLSFMPDGDLDLVFLDAHIDTRARELVRYGRFASPRCVWVVHDSRYPSVSTAIEELTDRGVLGNWISLPTPRGLTIGRYAKP